MSSQLCTHCFGVLSELLADEEDKTIHHEGELVAYPLTCYFCAKLCFREAHGIEPPFRLADLRYDIETHFPSKLQSIFVQFTPAALVALGGSGTSTRNFCITSLSGECRSNCQVFLRIYDLFYRWQPFDTLGRAIEYVLKKLV